MINLLSTAVVAKNHAFKLSSKHSRVLLPIILCVLLTQNATQNMTLSVLSDAFWQVAVFVAITLTLYHLFSDKISRLYTNSKGEKNPSQEIIIASFMGVLPGCGGAIIVITQYVSGQMSFGAVAAVLTSTMGDAAFLLLATEPLTGVGIVALCFMVGITSGLVVNKIHGPNFLRHTIKSNKATIHIKPTNSVIPKSIKYQGVLWQWIMIPGTIIGLLMAGQVDFLWLFHISESSIQLVGASVSFSFILLWSITPNINNHDHIAPEDRTTQQASVFQKVALDTNFVTSWVVVAFLLFELVMLFGDFQLETLFHQIGNIAPLAGVIIGMIPGCGPQIITTSLYLAGVIPLSAQIGNAISNDGDALFPAIALSPKVALVATVYSSIPAILAAYGYYWLFE